MAFLAKLLVDGRAKLGELYGIGVDENTCLVIDENGKIRVFGPGSAWILLPLTMPDACKAGFPLVWSGKAVKAVKIAGSAAGFTAADNGYLDWKTVRTLPATSWLSIENGTLMELAGKP